MVLKKQILLYIYIDELLINLLLNTTELSCFGADVVAGGGGGKRTVRECGAVGCGCGCVCDCGGCDGRCARGGEGARTGTCCDDCDCGADVD